MNIEQAFRALHSVPSDIKLQGIVKLQEISDAAMSKLLAGPFRFGEDGRVKWLTRLSMTSVYESYRPLFSQLAEWSTKKMVRFLLADMETVISNSLPDGRKFSRLLVPSAFVSDIDKHIQSYPDIFRPLLPDLPKDNSKLSLPVIVQQLFNCLGQRELEVTLSVNREDFLAASHDSSFDSCYKPGGQYQAAPLQYCTSPNTAILYGTRPGSTHKLLRAWLFFFDPECKYFMLGRVYGINTNLVWSFILERLQQFVKNTESNPHYCQIDGGLDYAVKMESDSSASLIYNDRPFACVLPKGNPSTIKRQIHLHSLMCPVCGEKPLTSSSSNCCNLCAQKYQGQCGRCGKYSWKGSLSSFKGGNICPTCKQTKVQVCACCGEEEYIDYLIKVDEGRVCQTCYRQHYTNCQKCGRSKKREEGDVSNLCRACSSGMEKKACTGCGTVHAVEWHGGHFQDQYYCNNCLAWTMAEYIRDHIRNGRLQG